MQFQVRKLDKFILFYEDVSPIVINLGRMKHLKRRHDGYINSDSYTEEKINDKPQLA